MAITYKQAKENLCAYLRSQGYEVKEGLKVPHATSRDGSIRFWFKPQAVWMSVGNAHVLGGAHSTWIDIREVTPEQFLARTTSANSLRNRANYS